MSILSRRALLYGAPTAAGAAVLAKPEAAVAAVATGASPKDYGAVGDGVADDTTAINQCLATNRAVDLGGPENMYLITDTLYVQQSAPCVVTGYGATIKAGAPVNMMRLNNARHSISGVVFDGANQSAGVGLIVAGTAPHSRIERCSFVDIAACAVAVSPGAHHTKIVGCLMDHCGHAASVAEDNYRSTIYIADADYCAVLDNEALRCNWGVIFRGDTQGTGINLYNCRGNTVTCMSPAPLTSQGISNRYGRNGRIENNTIVGFDDNCIDCWGCTNMTIAGNNTIGGKDGVFVGDPASSSFAITGNVFRSPQRAVRVLTGYAGALVIGVVISGNTVSYPTDGGILVSEEGTAQVSGITIADNDLHIADAGTYGIKMIRADSSRISGNRIYRPDQQAIYLDGVDVVEVSDNILQDAGHGAANTYDAIYVTNSNRVMLRNNTMYGSARYAVSITGGTGMTVTGTRWRALGTGGVNNAATSTVLSDNVQL